MSDEQEYVPKEFNDANIRAARRFKAERDALVKALEQILAGSKNADIGNSEFRLKALQTAQGVLGHVGTVVERGK